MLSQIPWRVPRRVPLCLVVRQVQEHVEYSELNAYQYAEDGVLLLVRREEHHHEQVVLTQDDTIHEHDWEEAGHFKISLKHSSFLCF